MDEQGLIERIGRTVAAHRMLSEAGPVVLMVSGGSDSVALARLVPQGYPQGRYTVLHVNHMLRGQDADDDERFVVGLARERGLACEVRRVDVAALAAAQVNGNVEDVGRQVRYRAAEELLDRLCREAGCDGRQGRIVTAHTRDDRVETFLMRVVVGGGGSGLGSIPFVNGRVIRPLLDCTREELRAYLRGLAASSADAQLAAPADLGVDPQPTATADPSADPQPPAPAPFAAAPAPPAPALWREDGSNADTRRLRAFVRHDLIPLLQTRNPQLLRSVGRSLDVLSAEDAFLAGLADELEERFVEEGKDGALSIDVALLDEDRVLARRVVRTACKRVMPPAARLTFGHIENIVAEGRHIGFATDIPGDVTVRNVYGTLVIRRKTAAEKPRHDPRHRPMHDSGHA
ncbi:MAG: tRNA lysidine(34) synthetase TilS [Coriobacteriales bacterium]|jgi:tRNA(Ile)-lysidine synthase|nr:tRNA lysidine(34) synthetase TilS [Coriobacteriales bacterium]